MLIRNQLSLTYADVTPQSYLLHRRAFLLGAAIGGSSLLQGSELIRTVKSPFSTSEKQNTYDQVTHYNNFYEFGTKKTQPAELAKGFKTDPWVVSVEGAVAKPQRFSLDDLMRLAPLEERIYRHRCVEAWSIVVPWIGYSLADLLKKAQPTSSAKYVAFESFYDPNQMPEAKNAGIQLPYVEGLRVDEANHPLTLLCVGMYGQKLPPQDGAPVRLVVPWKYGFKSIKSLVKITVTSDQPSTTWNIKRANEYGFYANVNPQVDHPRWSQAKERRLGEYSKRPTLMFNGYGDSVARLYTGMDLKKDF
jgi:methionine sulfoxide reductase catalytic subunit